MTGLGWYFVTLEGDAALTLSHLFSSQLRHDIHCSEAHANTIIDDQLDVIAPKTSLRASAGHLSPLHAVMAHTESHSEADADNSIDALSLQERMMMQTVYALTGALEAKDAYTCGHSRAVAQYATHLCNAINLSGDTVEHIRLAALLHDIGKIGIPESILNKNGPLTRAEWEIMNQHPVIGAQKILAPIAGLSPILPYVAHHHEHWDGSGGPQALVGESIPLGARIVSIVDAYHALTSRRSYREALSKHETVEILKDGAGIKWDPTLMGIFLNMITR